MVKSKYLLLLSFVVRIWSAPVEGPGPAPNADDRHSGVSCTAPSKLGRGMTKGIKSHVFVAIK